jgi:hypothetical protein
MVGTQIPVHEAVTKRINKLTETTEHKEIELYEYSFGGYRLEIPTDGIHLVPNDITAIVDNTDWSFTGCKDGSVTFEGSPDTL